MIQISKPKAEQTKTSSDNKHAVFVLEPLEGGYGDTLGNSLRRILLSSMPGVAPIWVDIDTVLHEFSIVEGVKEDVVEIVLNLKNLCAKFTNNEIDRKIVRLNVDVEGPVTAADIDFDSDVEIVNPDLHIATLTKGGKLNMEICLVKSRGYSTAEQNKENESDMPIGTIFMDSIFTPIRKVNYKVENTRVGQRTDFGKLTIEVLTDGSITPSKALALSSKIMFEHLQLFIDIDEEVAEYNIMTECENVKKSKIFEMTIDELELSVRSYNCLRRAGINKVEELVQKTEEDMAKVRNLGKKSLTEVKNKLEELNLSFNNND